MALAIPVVSFSRAGAVLPDALPGDIAEGHTLANDGKVGLIVRNTDVAAPHSVTISLSRTVDGQTVTPRVIAVPMDRSLALGPFDPADYGTKVSVTVDSAALTLVGFTGI